MKIDEAIALLKERAQREEGDVTDAIIEDTDADMMIELLLELKEIQRQYDLIQRQGRA